jgi:tRNA(fMet)-specific endonuclease VapC
MSLYIFDTDVMTLYERMHPGLIRNIFHHILDDIQVSSITVEEQISGWFTMLRSAQDPQQIEVAHRRLASVVLSLGTWDIIPFTAAAELRFQDLRKRRLNVRGNDLRIAAIALEAGATVVTKNLRDFKRVPGLQCEDWSI